MSLTYAPDAQWDEDLESLAAVQRGRAAEFAFESRLLARLESKTQREGWQAESPYDSLILEVAGTALIGQQAASHRIDQAVHLVRRLPRLLEEMDAGTVWLPQARVLIEETAHCDPGVCAEVESRILPDARIHQPGVLRRKVRAVILAVDAEEAARRAAKATTDRGVQFRAIEDSQGLLIAKGPAGALKALELQLNAEAKALAAAGDPRTMDQLRFDLLCSHQSNPNAKPLQALITVPVATALGLSDEPGHLDGYGPLPAPLVRQLLTDAELRKVCVDRSTGRVVGIDQRVRPAAGDLDGLRRELLTMVEQPTTVDLTPEPQHDASAALARLVKLRDAACDGPGCSVHVGQCELDHQIPYPHGPTSAGNLRPRSQRCHHAKHAGWTVTTDLDGTSHWTSPTGRTYTVPTRDRPPPALPPDARLRPPQQVAAADQAALEPEDDGDQLWTVDVEDEAA